MVVSFRFGMVDVRGEDFRESCLTFPQNNLKELEYELPVLVSSKADYLVSIISVRVKSLANSIQCFLHRGITFCSVCLYRSPVLSRGNVHLYINFLRCMHWLLCMTICYCNTHGN